MQLAPTARASPRAVKIRGRPGQASDPGVSEGQAACCDSWPESGQTLQSDAQGVTCGKSSQTGQLPHIRPGNHGTSLGEVGRPFCEEKIHKRPCSGCRRGTRHLVGRTCWGSTEPVALLGAALGGVRTGVHRQPLVRLGGFAAGFIVAWMGYVLRAALLPDTPRRVAAVAVVVVMLCVCASDRRPGAVVERTAGHGGHGRGLRVGLHSGGTPEAMTTSVSAATTVLLARSRILSQSTVSRSAARA